MSENLGLPVVLVAKSGSHYSHYVYRLVIMSCLMDR